MSGILGKMKAVARGHRVPTEADDDCEICRALAAQNVVVETIELPDGLVRDPAPPTVDAQLSSLGVTDEQRAGMATLAERIYGHVMRVVMLDRLYAVEQIVWGELLRLGFKDESGELATGLMSEALHRVGYSSERCVSMIPDGISDDEVLAAEYDDDCVFCRCEVADMQYRRSGRKCCDLQRDAEDKDLRRFMDQAAKRWRAENAEALRRFGLA